MESQIEVTRKDLNFINETDLRNILRDRLEELDRVFVVNGHYSTVFLAVSCIEGAFKHIAEIFRTEIRASAQYPRKSNGQPKDFNDLTIDELRLLLASGLNPTYRITDEFIDRNRTFALVEGTACQI
jgi:hypothetical protein